MSKNLQALATVKMAELKRGCVTMNQRAALRIQYGIRATESEATMFKRVAMILARAD